MGYNFPQIGGMIYREILVSKETTSLKQYRGKKTIIGPKVMANKFPPCVKNDDIKSFEIWMTYFNDNMIAYFDHWMHRTRDNPASKKRKLLQLLKLVLT
jgi:hypothetical protein